MTQDNICPPSTTIALDYDGTVTTDHEAYAAFIKLFRSRGHVIYIVTMRYNSECLNDPRFMQMASLCNGYIATGRQAKRQACVVLNIHPHIWFDDNPIAVEKSAVEIWGTASPEGEVVIEVHDNNQPNRPPLLITTEA